MSRVSGVEKDDDKIRNVQVLNKEGDNINLTINNERTKRYAELLKGS